MKPFEHPGDGISFAIVHAYDSDDPEFVRGAEVGSLEAKLQLMGNVAVREVMRRTNAEMVRRIAEGAGRRFSIAPIDETWIEVTIEPAAPRDGSMPGFLRALD